MARGAVFSYWIGIPCNSSSSLCRTTRLFFNIVVLYYCPPRNSSRSCTRCDVWRANEVPWCICCCTLLVVYQDSFFKAISCQDHTRTVNPCCQIASLADMKNAFFHVYEPIALILAPKSGCELLELCLLPAHEKSEWFFAVSTKSRK